MQYIYIQIYLFIYFDLCVFTEYVHIYTEYMLVKKLYTSLGCGDFWVVDLAHNHVWL